MHSVSLEYAQAHLAELLVEVAGGEEIVIERDSRPVGRLVAEPLPQAAGAGWAGLGRYEGQGWMAPDFNDIPEGFESDAAAAVPKLTEPSSATGWPFMGRYKGMVLPEGWDDDLPLDMWDVLK